jgi:hypothetical protein
VQKPPVDDMNSRAVIAYLWGSGRPHPHTDERAVIEEFGEPCGWDLLSYAKAVCTEMNDVKIDWDAHTLDSASRQYAEQVRTAHPELSDAAIEGLRRAFSFWFK